MMQTVWVDSSSNWLREKYAGMRATSTIRPRGTSPVCLVSLVGLARPVFLVQPNKQDKPNTP